MANNAPEWTQDVNFLRFYLSDKISTPTLSNAQIKQLGIALYNTLKNQKAYVWTISDGEDRLGNTTYITLYNDRPQYPGQKPVTKDYTLSSAYAYWKRLGKPTDFRRLTYKQLTTWNNKYRAGLSDDLVKSITSQINKNAVPHGSRGFLEKTLDDVGGLDPSGGGALGSASNFAKNPIKTTKTGLAHLDDSARHVGKNTATRVGAEILATAFFGPTGGAIAGGALKAHASPDGAKLRGAAQGALEGYTVGKTTQKVADKVGIDLPSDPKTDVGGFKLPKNPTTSGGTDVVIDEGGATGASSSGFWDQVIPRKPDGSVDWGKIADDWFGLDPNGAGIIGSVRDSGSDLLFGQKDPKTGQRSGGILSKDTAASGAEAFFNYLGMKEAAKIQRQTVQDILNATEFTPYNLSTPFGSVNFNGTTGRITLGPRVAPLLSNFLNSAAGNLHAASTFNPNAYAQDVYNQLSQLAAIQENAQRAQFDNTLFARGMLGSTGGALQRYALERALQDKALQREQIARSLAEQIQNNLFNRATASTGAAINLNNAALNALNTAGLFGAYKTRAGGFAAPMIGNVGMNIADAKAGFYSGLGDTIGGLFRRRG